MYTHKRLGVESQQTEGVLCAQFRKDEGRGIEQSSKNLRAILDDHSDSDFQLHSHIAIRYRKVVLDHHSARILVFNGIKRLSDTRQIRFRTYSNTGDVQNYQPGVEFKFCRCQCLYATQRECSSRNVRKRITESDAPSVEHRRYLRL